MLEHTTLYNTGASPFGKSSPSFGWVKEHVALGEHVHVLSRTEAFCWNGPCPTLSKGINIKKGMKL